MSLAGLSHIREPVLRGLLLALGVGFVLVAGVIAWTHAWQADESRAVLLVPFVSGLAAIAAAWFCRGAALRLAAVGLTLGLPAGTWLVVQAVCALGWATTATCG